MNSKQKNMTNEIDELKNLYSKYTMIHDQYSRIEREAKRLEEERLTLSELLNETREAELSLINKIEEGLGKKLSTDDLIEIITNHE